MANPEDQTPLGGDPPTGGPYGSLEAEEKAMKKGKGRMVAAMVVAGVGALVALALYMMSGDEGAYSKFGKKVNGLDQQHFDAFFGCVLQGYDLDRIKSDQDLRNQLHMRAETGRDRFAVHIRDKCLPTLSAMEPELSATVPPEELADPLRDLTDAVGRLRGAVSDYIAYLDGLGDEEPYIRDGAEEQVGRIAKAWYDYRVALGALNRGLKIHLE